MEEDVLNQVFEDLDTWIDEENARRRGEGQFSLKKFEIKILGQMCLLANEKISGILNLVVTRDLDADLGDMEYQIKKKMIELLKKNNLVYDEDSEKIWLPPGRKFEVLWEKRNFVVSILDPESALVSKAIKAKEKNKILIQDAIASEKFPNLVDRIESNGGDLTYFLE